MKNVQDAFNDVEIALTSREVPSIIEKGGTFCIGGNMPSAAFVIADQYGRMWREEADRLVLLFDPAQRSAAFKDYNESPKTPIFDYERKLA